MQENAPSVIPPLQIYKELQRPAVMHSLFSQKEEIARGESAATRYVALMITRSPSDTIPITRAEYEIPMLVEIWGEGNVTLIEESEQYFEVSPNLEYARITEMYGVNPDTKVMRVEEVYGRLNTGEFLKYFHPLEKVNAGPQGEQFDGLKYGGMDGIDPEKAEADLAKTRAKGMTLEEVTTELAGHGLPVDHKLSHAELYEQLAQTFDQNRLREELVRHGGSFKVTEGNAALLARLTGKATGALDAA